MKPLERRLAALEAALAPASAPLVIRRTIVDRTPDGTLVETLCYEITVGNVRVTLPDNGRDELPPD
ncbi:hypothetical protein GCM10010909_07740 [Acidocella aquatica]|uniref:PepSY domain-containing protein n=1 Tax=Acidocella aquatica TaxID=1922313 RepID=A0ABQ6A0Y9_9PROT|nr:hypothetical protein [Acidocella aquatica]GLR66096.1 hypothetical protein GCM10010909_07740 [Acidocella aquatica]